MNPSIPYITRSIVCLPPDCLRPGERFFHPEEDPAAFAALRESLNRYGMLQPLTVRPLPPSAREGDGVSLRSRRTEVSLIGCATEFEILDGVRRYAAALAEGWTAIPCCVLTAAGAPSPVWRLLLQGQQKAPDTIALADTAAELDGKSGDPAPAGLWGVDPSRLPELTALTALSPEERQVYRQYGLTPAHITPLLRLPAGDFRCELLREAAEAALSPDAMARAVDTVLTRCPEAMGAPKGKHRFAFRDWGLLMNTLHRAVSTLSEAGIQAELTSEETENGLEIHLHVPFCGKTKNPPVADGAGE